MQFAKDKLARLGNEEERRPTDLNVIRTKMRSIARLLLKVREITRTKLSLSDYLKPQYFDAFVEAAKILSKSPRLGLCLGHYLRTLILLKISGGIVSGVKEEREEADDFKHLFEAHWSARVASVAGRRQKLRRLNASEDLPLTEDLVRLSEFNKNIIETEYDNLNKLSKYCLAQLILFNKRRPMEVAELTKQDFRHIEDYQQDNAEVMKSLDKTESLLTQRCASMLHFCLLCFNQECKA